MTFPAAPNTRSQSFVPYLSNTLDPAYVIGTNSHANFKNVTIRKRIVLQTTCIYIHLPELI
jgi:hypothetical protein